MEQSSTAFGIINENRCQMTDDFYICTARTVGSVEMNYGQQEPVIYGV